jgi:GNAT superfamily N-acetyltransferase
MNPVQESSQIMIDTWKTFCARLSTGTVSEAPGVVAAFGNVSLAFLNICFHDSPIRGLQDLEGRLLVAKELARGCPFPWFFSLCEEWAPEGWQAKAQSLGFQVAVGLVGMATDELLPPRRELALLDYARVDDDATARKIADINCLAYGMPLEEGDGIAVASLWPEDSFGYLGLANGSAVTCSATFPVNETRYVGFVATLPDEHRKGYAEAVMRYSLTRAATELGFQRTALHATAAGAPLYEAMGYKPCARFSLLVTV